MESQQCRRRSTYCGNHHEEVDLHSGRRLLLIGEPETEATARGPGRIFYPRFHCELNYTEFFCSAVKRYTRENFSFVNLEGAVQAGLDSVFFTTSIWHFAN